jgi:hypothetical protein
MRNKNRNENREIRRIEKYGEQRNTENREIRRIENKEDT